MSSQGSCSGSASTSRRDGGNEKEERKVRGKSEMEKKSVFSLENFVKEQPAKTASPRLQSFRLPRDLSLGGTKPKKVYAPNLNVVRQKNKPKEFIRKTDVRKSVRGNQRNVEKKPHSQRFIQTQGIFSEGSGEARRHQTHFERQATNRQQETIPMPKITKKSLSVQDTTKENAIASAFLEDSESEEEDDFYEPLVLSSEMFSKKEGLDNKTYTSCLKLDKDVKDKVEEASHAATLPSSQELFSSTFLESEMYSDSNPSFSIIQFPDSFPGRGGSDDPNDKSLDLKLKNVMEGKLGDIIIRKSGKMQLQVGKMLYDFEVGNSPAYTEDIVTILSEDEHGDIKICKIGEVDEHYIVVPIWDKLFQK